MAADPNKANSWANARVLVAPAGSAIPATENDAFSVDWVDVGCLDGTAGFEFTQSSTKTDRFAWGIGKINTSRKDWAMMLKFTALEGEENDTVRSLIWPGSTGQTRVTPYPERLMVATELTEGASIKREISIHECEVEVDGVRSTTEGEVVATTFMATLYPNGDGEWLKVQPDYDGPTLASLAVAPAPSAVAATELVQLVATATYSDASTADVTTSAMWTSATPAKATVPYGSGVVLGIAAGTSVITAAYGGLTATSTVTVS